MNNERKLNRINGSKMRGNWMYIKVTCAAFVPIPLNIKSISIDKVKLANSMLTIDFKNNFYIGLNTEKYIKLDFSPAKIKTIIKVINSLKIAA